MKRTIALTTVAAVLVAAFAVGGVLLVTSSQHDDATQHSRFAATSERAPEAENHSDQGLPVVDRAARSFLASYLPVVYAKRGASLDAVQSASPTLIAALAAEGGRVTPAQATRHPVVKRVTLIHDGPLIVQATARINDAANSTYILNFRLEHTQRGWLVTRIGGG